MNPADNIMSSDYNICDDLLLNIFVKLPPKSIIRFRSLSKHWHSRFSTPEFIRNHRLLQCSQKVLIKHNHLPYCENKYEYEDTYTLHLVDQLPLDTESGYEGIPGVKLPYRPTFLMKRPLVAGSCNGILCFFSDEISVWNFSIRRRLIVSGNPFWKQNPYDRITTIGFDFALGFGFDPITDDYKIVTISYSKHAFDESYTFMYSLKTESWCGIPSPSTRFHNVKSKPCFVNGILHWVVDGYLTAEQTPENRICFILTFNLSSHDFGHILLPEPLTIIQLTTINGCLAVVSWEDGDNWIWVMKKEYGETESWSMCYIPETRGAFDLIGVLQPIANGDILSYYKGSEVYNLKTRLLKKLVKFGPCCSAVEMEPYVESLELLDNESATNYGKTVFSWRGETKKKRIRL